MIMKIKLIILVIILTSCTSTNKIKQKRYIDSKFENGYGTVHHYQNREIYN